jgi:Zn-dependent M16 (insulinase) family peptidase
MSKAQFLDQPGTEVGAFTLKAVNPVPEIRCVQREFIHRASGATVLHIEADDPENVFCLSFRTTPNSSDGVAHILEHTVLCGSDKYPVHDPFFSMTRRSLNTFMNAFTGQDFTCYPAASQVKEDFYNLLDVYVDAVFYPKIERFAFLQEGHRLEFEDAENPASPLSYKGIVYNEMKGALGSADARFWESMNAALFPDVTYGVNSGGDPKVIPELTHEGLKAFHSTYYHPSRCLFYFYGNLPIQDHLTYLEERVLAGVSNPGSLDDIPLQDRFRQRRSIVDEYPISEQDEEEGKTQIGLGWLTCRILDQLELLALSVLDIVLMDTDASPLKKALLRSGLCSEAELAISEELNEVPLVLKCKGCTSDAAPAILELVQNTLKELLQRGIPTSAVESALHQLELDRAEITGDSYPYGLSLFFRAGLLRQHAGQPEEALCIHSLFNQLHAKLENPDYLTGLIEKYLIHNPHQVLLTLNPSKDLEQREAADERARLDAIQKELSEDDARRLVKQARTLENYQTMHADDGGDLLPIISASAIPKDPDDFSLQGSKLAGADIHWHDTFTNQFIYADLVFDLPQMPEDDLWIAQLFAQLLSQVGTAGRDYTETLELQQEHTGGLDASFAVFANVRKPSSLSPGIIVSGKALRRKAGPFFALLRDMVQEPSFEDSARLRELLIKHAHLLEQSLAPQALNYAMLLSGASHSAYSALNSQWNGLPYYWKVRDLVNHLDERLPQLQKRLQQLAQTLMHQYHAQLVLSTDADSFALCQKERFWGLLDYRPQDSSPWKNGPQAQPLGDRGLIIPASVAFSSQVLPAVPYTHCASAPLALAAKLANRCLLHKRIREQGGAYGGGASYQSTVGTFSFFAYRDPNLSQSALAFQEAAELLAQGNFSEEHLREAKLEMIQKLDSPLAPGSRGITAFSWNRQGLNFETRRAFRHKVLESGCNAIKKAAEEFLLPAIPSSSLVSLSGKALLEREAEPLLKVCGRKMHIASVHQAIPSED